MSDQDDLVRRSTELTAKASTVFQPRTPINTRDLFAGRWAELTEISDAVHQPGLHVAIFGERGVGKTSLSNVVSPTIWALDRVGLSEEQAEALPERLVLKAVANSSDTFSTIWVRLLAELRWPNPDTLTGGTVSTKTYFELPDLLGIDEVRRVLQRIPGSVFIIDEFDQARRVASKDFTELIKALSDLVIDCTIVLVGVSETIQNLVADHASIIRAVAQIGLKRMKPDELRMVLEKAERALKIQFTQDASNLIVHVSQGLPHYTHLIGLHSVRSAAGRLSLSEVTRDDVFEAMQKAVKQAEQTITEKHSKATHSSQKNALYRRVLLACAVSASKSHDALGYFNPSAVTEPLSKILARDVTIATFTNHLREFCEEKRGLILERDGEPWGYRYRFRDPLLVPFVFMDGVDAGLTTGRGLVEMLSS